MGRMGQISQKLSVLVDPVPERERFEIFTFPGTDHDFKSNQRNFLSSGGDRLDKD